MKKKKYMLAATVVAVAFMALVACDRNGPNAPKPVAMSPY
jgi:hypothetical protein